MARCEEQVNSKKTGTSTNIKNGAGQAAEVLLHTTVLMAHRNSRRADFALMRQPSIHGVSNP
jgi:hypothetical protein